MGQIKKIVLTGGPSGGKSTLARLINEALPDVLVMPEAATILLSGGYPVPGKTHPWTQAWQDAFQDAVIAIQNGIDKTGLERAGSNNKKAIIFDRGLPDAGAYLKNGLEQLSIVTGISRRQMLNQYDLVVHLPSSATDGAYDKLSNPHRIEEAERASHLEQRTLEVWQDHPNRIIVEGADAGVRIQKAMEIVKEYLLN